MINNDQEAQYTMEGSPEGKEKTYLLQLSSAHNCIAIGILSNSTVCTSLKYVSRWREKAFKGQEEEETHRARAQVTREVMVIFLPTLSLSS